jgi:Flp pilus assembly protein TadG
MRGRKATLGEMNNLMFRWRSAFRLRSWRRTVGGTETEQNRSSLLSEKGSTIIEMALGSIILFTMIIGAFEICLALYTYNFISEAAREGARYAIVRGSGCTSVTNCNATSAQIQTYVRSLAYGGTASSANMTVTTIWLSASSTTPTTWTSCGATQCNAPGNAVQVKVTYALPLMLPFRATNTWNMSSTSQMVIAN